MERQQLLIVGCVLVRLVLGCSAATYIVGDTSGWDIASDLTSWPNGKNFLVGDALVFQYSSYHSLDEVTEDNFKACNTTNIIKSYTNGNTTVTLSNPGDRFFVCGNRLHCLGGMKLHVKVGGNQAYAPVPAPTAAAAPDHPPPSSTRQQPSLKNDNNLPSSTGFTNGVNVVFLVFLFFVYRIIKF